MSKCFEEVPECFEPDSDRNSHMLCGRSAENWNRAYEICRAYWRMNSDAKQTDMEAEKKKQNRPAIKPTFLTDADLSRTTTEEENKLTTVNLDEYLRGLKTDDAESNDDEETLTMEPTQLMKLSDRFNEEFAKSFRHISAPLHKIDEENFRPRLDYNNHCLLLAHIGQEASVLYPRSNDDSDALLEADPVTQSQARASMAEEVLGDAESVSEQTRTRFWSLMNSLNKVMMNKPEQLLVALN